MCISKEWMDFFNTGSVEDYLKYVNSIKKGSTESEDKRNCT